MDAGAFSDDSIVQASEPFVRIMLNCTKKTTEQGEWMKRLGVKGFPTIVFLESKGRVLGRLSGAHPAGAYLEKIGEVLGNLPERRLRLALGGLGAWKAWMEERLERLGDPDIDVREQATRELKGLRDALEAALDLASKSEDEEIRARVQYVRGERRAAPIVVPVRAHSIQKVGPVQVEFGCVTQDALYGATISGMEYGKVEVVGESGQIVELVERAAALPSDFGKPKELRIYPRP